jgi:hypothetical protein
MIQQANFNNLIATSNEIFGEQQWSSPSTVMVFEKDLDYSWERFDIPVDNCIKRLRKNKTIKTIRVVIKPITLTGNTHHREMYDRLYEAFHSGEYLERLSFGRYMCNILHRHAKTLGQTITSIRFELFIENLLQLLADSNYATTVSAFHTQLERAGKTTKSFEDFARGFYEALMSDFRESFQKD